MNTKPRVCDERLALRVPKSLMEAVRKECGAGEVSEWIRSAMVEKASAAKGKR